MNALKDKEIERLIRDAFGVGDNDVIIDKITDSQEMRKIGLDNSDFSNYGACWRVAYNNHSDDSLVKKFDLDKLNFLGLPLIFVNWSLNCEIIAQNKIVSFPIMFSDCRANLKEDTELHIFSFRDFEFEKDVFFSKVEFVNVFENTKFKNIIFRNGSYWCRRNESKQEIQCFSFDGINVKKKLVLQDLDFVKSNSINKTEGDFSKLKILKEMHIINCIFQEEVEFNGLTLDTLTLSGVEFKERVSFASSEIKELTVQRDLRNLFDFIDNNQHHLKNTVFSKSCFFDHSNLGSLEFKDRTEFEDLSFMNISPITDDSKSQTSEGKEKKSKPIKINFQDIKINGNFNFNNFEVQSENIKIDLLSFEGVEFGGEVSFAWINIVEFGLKDQSLFNRKRKVAEPIFSKGEPSVLHDKCSFRNVTINEADFSTTHFEGKVNFYDTTFSRSISFASVIFDKDISFSSINFPREGNKSPILTNFSNTVFEDNVEFGEKILCRCSFDGAEFKQVVKFKKTNFLGFCSFFEASFSRVIFEDVAFLKESGGDERKEEKKGEIARFNRCKFGYLCFNNANFERLQLLDSVIQEKIQFFKKFKESDKRIEADFSETIFKEECDKMDFHSVIFVSPKFRSCTFEKSFNFENFKCEGEIDFSNAIFKDEVIFGSE